MLNKYYLVIKTICYSNCVVKASHVFNNHLIFISYREQCMYCTMKSGEAIYATPNNYFKINVLGLTFLQIHLPNDLFTHCVRTVSEGVMLVTACLPEFLSCCTLIAQVEQWLLLLPINLHFSHVMPRDFIELIGRNANISIFNGSPGS